MLMPLDADWIKVHVLTDNTRIGAFKGSESRFGVVVFAPDDMMHQLPVCDTAEQAEDLVRLLVAEFHKQQDERAA